MKLRKASFLNEQHSTGMVAIPTTIALFDHASHMMSVELSSSHLNHSPCENSITPKIKLVILPTEGHTFPYKLYV